MLFNYVFVYQRMLKNDDALQLGSFSGRWGGENEAKKIIAVYFSRFFFSKEQSYLPDALIPLSVFHT